MIKISAKSFKKIGTHDGRFHADEMMATAILQQIFQVEIIRTRNPDVLDKLDIVYDVGGGKFDHHGVEKELRDDKIPYAASGLIWREFGERVVELFDSSLSKEDIKEVYQHVDKILIKGIDALDNGLRPEQNDYFSTMSITTILSGFNPPWYIKGKEEERFNQGVLFSKQILNNVILQKVGVIKARGPVKEAYDKRKNPEILILDVNCPWQEAILELDKKEEVKITIFPDLNKYALQTVKGKDRKDRIKLPKEWGGKEEAELAQLTNVEDAVFCHSGLFFAAAKSLNGTVALAKAALES
ncbi:MYG1 family protein [Proteinivorax tanatarense]|uniref:MYG1 family protein n=1 Tax=Proteinivorax tanatarense TaxID=1260629 RepID=A0AAU7VLQ1_9FIRM